MSQRPELIPLRKLYATRSGIAAEVESDRVEVEANTTNDPPIKQPDAQLEVIAESEEAVDVSPLSGKPFFDVVFTKSHLYPFFQLTIPSKMYPELPSVTIPAFITYGAKKWEMVYGGSNNPRRIKRDGWKIFAVDNDLKIGDACVFELMECSSEHLAFKVQVLRGDFPTELLPRIDGLNVTNPLVIEE